MRISDWSSDVCSSDLLILINDALAPILRDLGPPEGGDAGSARTRLSTMATFISELIETHVDKCEDVGCGPDERPAHIVSETFGTQAQIASIAPSSRFDDAQLPNENVKASCREQ